MASDARSLIKVQVYLNRREKEIFERIKKALGEDDSSTFIYLMKRYAGENSLIPEALHQ